MSDLTLPFHASVVVIGGGVMGCSTLYHLAEAGVSDAILLERNRLTSGTTWHSAAQVRALRSTRNLTDLIRYSVSLYARLEEETGQSTGWINKGSLSIATCADRLVHIRRQEALAHLFGVRARSISVDEAKERWPLMHTDDVIGAVWSPDDGRVSPSDLCAALVKGARARGARIYEDTGVTGILTRSGRVTGVETNRGKVRCDAVALCTGLWSRKAAAMGNVEVPVWPCEHFYLLTEPVEGIEGNVPSLSDHDGHLYIRDDSGGLLIGCFEPRGKPINPDRLGEDFAFQLLPEDWDHFEPMMRNALHRLPALETAGVKMLLNGPESFTPDGSFLLGMSRAPGHAVYTVVLNERAGIESDLVALRLDEEDYRLFVGTAAVKRDMAWLTRHLVAGEEVTLDDETEAHAVLALTGPEAALVAEAAGAGALNELGYFQHGEARIAGVEVRGVRLSYVGEAGWEITCPYHRSRCGGCRAAWRRAGLPV